MPRFIITLDTTTLPDVVPDFSRGRKLILLHAAGSNAHAWHYQYEALGASHSPIAPDLPGHGRSAGVEGLRTVQDYADFAIAFADASRSIPPFSSGARWVVRSRWILLRVIPGASRASS